MNPFASCLKKQNSVKELFKDCTSTEDTYHKIIEIGKKQKSLEHKYKTADHLVKGCQSTMYLHSRFENGLVYFEAESDALISAGLAALLVEVYSGETPETILKCPPDYLEELGISGSLTPNRANGLYSIHLRMKQDALRFLMKG